MSANSNEIEILEKKRAKNPNGNIEELEKGQKVKSLKEKIEIMLNKDLDPNIYKTLRKEAKKLDEEYRATSDTARKLELMAEHTKIKEQFAVVRNNIQTFCEEIYRLENAALFVFPIDGDRAFYEKMMDIVKTYTKLFVPLDSDMKEDKENQITKENVSDKAQAKQPQSFKDRLAALKINHTGLGPQPIAAMPLAFLQQRKTEPENKTSLNGESMQQQKPSGF